MAWSCSAQNQELPGLLAQITCSYPVTRELRFLGGQGPASASPIAFTLVLLCYIKSTTLWPESHVDAPWDFGRDLMELLVQSPQLKDKELKVQRG